MKWLVFFLALAGLVFAPFCLAESNATIAKKSDSIHKFLTDIGKRSKEFSKVGSARGLRLYSFKSFKPQHKASAPVKVSETPLAPKIKSRKPVREVLQYEGKACRQTGSNSYFIVQGQSCNFRSPDEKRNQWSCDEANVLQCSGFYCPVDACGALGVPKEEDRSPFAGKKRPAHPI